MQARAGNQSSWSWALELRRIKEGGFFCKPIGIAANAGHRSWAMTRPNAISAVQKGTGMVLTCRAAEHWEHQDRKGSESLWYALSTEDSELVKARLRIQDFLTATRRAISVVRERTIPFDDEVAEGRQGAGMDRTVTESLVSEWKSTGERGN